MDISIRAMNRSDLPEAMRLGAAAGWNQLEDDWLVFLRSPGHCFAATYGNQLVGTAVGIDYGTVSWVSMVLVDPGYRRLGIATRMVRAVMDSLTHCPCLGLDATADGHAVYNALGFDDGPTITRLVCRALPPQGAGEACGAEPLTCSDLDALTALDAEVFGVDRRRLLQALLERSPELAWKVERGGSLVAGCLGRNGRNFYGAGPVLARTFVDAQAVVAPVMRALAGQPLAMDVPEASGDMKSWLMTIGFEPQRHFVRQWRGVPVQGSPGAYFATAGPEFG